MSNSPTAQDQQSADTDTDREAGSLEQLTPGLATPIRKTGFWAAIVLPLIYIPLLATGLSSSTQTLTFLLLLGVNLVALYVGHAHKKRAESQ